MGHFTILVWRIWVVQFFWHSDWG